MFHYHIKRTVVLLIRLVQKSYLCLCLLYFLTNLPSYTFAQTSEIDSFQNVLSGSIEDIERIDLMIELSSSLLDVDYEKSIFYAKQALELSQNTNNIEYEIKALYNIGLLLYDSKDKRRLALEYFVKGEQMAEEHHFDQLQSDLLMRLANYYRYNEIDSTKTVNYLLKSITVSKAVNYHYGTARSYAKLASFYTRFKQVQLCEDYLQSSAQYYLKIENGKEEIAHYYDEVGNKIWDYSPKKSMDLFFKGLKYANSYPNLKVSLAKAHIAIDEPQMAIKYLNEALLILEKKPDPRIKGLTLAGLAQTYLMLNKHITALKVCNEGIAFLKPLSIGNKSGLPALYRTKAVLMEGDKNEKAALQYYEKSIKEGHKINEPFEAWKSNIYLGIFYTDRNPKKGEKYCELGLEGARENNYTSLEIAACECLYNINKSAQSYSKALAYFEQRNQLSDSLSTLKVVHALDVNNQIVIKEKEKEINEAQLKNQYRINTILIISSSIGLLLIGLLSRGIRRISKQNTEITNKTAQLLEVNKNLARSNEELERFAYIASHDLKSPLKNMISFAGLLRHQLKNEALDEESTNQYISYIVKSGTRMNNLIDDILEYSKLSSKDSTENEVISLNELVEEISQLLQNNSNGKLFNIETSKLPKLKWNYSKIFLLFKNFIENGLKYNESNNPTVKINFTKTENSNLVHFVDNGIGIEQEYFDKIFIMFHRLHGTGKYDGTGLGLATCKKIVDEFNGNINISSQIGRGTSFKIEIPNHLIYNGLDN